LLNCKQQELQDEQIVDYAVCFIAKTYWCAYSGWELICSVHSTRQQLFFLMFLFSSLFLNPSLPLRGPDILLAWRFGEQAKE